MPLATSARALLQRLRPWLSKAVHVRWTLHRSFYQKEADALLLALSRYQGRMPHDLALRLEGFLGRLHREWFPPTWRKNPTYAEVVRDFRWWLDIARQPEKLLRMLRLPQNVTRTKFLVAWRRFLKENHPDLNPGQTAEERRRFAEAVALWRR